MRVFQCTSGDWSKEKMIEIAEILLNVSKQTKVTTTVPTNVSTNTTFLIYASCPDNIEDLKCDDLSIWHCTGITTDLKRWTQRNNQNWECINSCNNTIPMKTLPA